MNAITTNEVTEEEKLQPLTAYIKNNQVYLKLTSEVKTLREKGFGQRKYNTITLTSYETLYLIEKEKIIVLDQHSKTALSFKDLVKLLCKENVETWIKYLVFRDLRERGYIVRDSNLVDFEISGKTVVRRLVTIIHEGTDASIVRLNKLLQYMKKERKELVAAVIDRRTDIVYYILDSMEFDRLKAPWLTNKKSS